MSRRLSQSDPALDISFFSSGFYTYRSQLFAPFKGIGINVVAFHDPVIDGSNFELTDKLQWTRRPGFSKLCPILLPPTEVVNQFYSSRNLNGTVIPFVDTSTRWATFSSTSLTTIAAKNTASQGYISTVGNRTYFADGSPNDLYTWDGANLAAWGLAAPTIAPVASGQGFWQPLTGFAIGNTILDTNGSIESVSAILTSNGGVEEPTAFSILPLAGGVGTWAGSIGPSSTISQSFSATGYSNYLFLQNFNFAIPSDATILGVVVSLPKQAMGGVITDQSVKLVVGGVVSGAERASGLPWNDAGLTSFNYGSPLDTWGLSLTPSQINANGLSGFGLAVAADVTSTTLFKLVQTATSYSLFPVPLTISTFPNTVTAGNTIIACVCAFHDAPVSISDNQGNSYTLAASVLSGEFATYVYVASNVAAGTTSITVNELGGGAGNEFLCLNCQEMSGILSVSPVETTATNSAPSSPFNTGTVTTSNVSDLIFSYVYANGGGSASPVGYSLATTTSFSAAGNTQQLATAFNVPGSAGSYSPTWGRGALGITVALKATSLATAVIGAGDPNAPLVTIYYKQASGAGGPGLSGANEPIWATTIGNSVNDGGLTWTDYGPIETWFPLTAYPVPTVVLDTNGNLQIITSIINPVAAWDVGATYTTGQIVSFAGSYWVSTYPGSNTGVAPNSGYTTATTSGSTTTTTPWWAQASNPIVTGDIAPVWNTALSGTTVDGSYVWTNIGQGSGPAFLGYAYVYGYRTVYGHLTTSSPFSNNTGAILGPLNGSISGYSIFGNAVTFTGNNNFQPGNVFTVTGLTVGTFLNNQSFTVISAVPSSSFPLTAVAVSGSNVLTVTALNNLIAGQTVTFNNVGTATFLNGVTVTVLSSGLSDTQFEANFTHASYGPTPDTGNVSVLGSWTANFTHASVGATVDSGEALPLIAAIAGVGTGSPLCNSVANITRVSVTANVVTITASNNFQPGLWVTLAGISNAMFLNGLQFQVIAVDQPVGTQNTWFQVYMETPNYISTADTGTATFNAVEIYRTSDGGGTYLFDGAITNPGAGVAWSYNDFVVDADLDILLVAPLGHQNDPPPGAPGSSVSTTGSVIMYWQGRLWMCVGNYVYFDAGPDCTNGVPEESWPPANRFQFAGPTLGLEPTPDGVGLMVYLADRVAAILGGPETISFYPTDAFNNFGISNTNAIFKDGSTIGLFTTQKQYFELAGENKEHIGEHIADYLSSNFNSTTTYATMHRDGLDVGVFLSNGVDRVLRFNSNIGAWSVPAFPSFGAGALRSIETSVGVYTLMLATPNGGTSNYLYGRDLDSWGDGGTYGENDGTPYIEANIVLGSITLSQLGAPVFALQHIVGYFDAVGTLGPNGMPSVPDVWILPNEIVDTPETQFIQLPEVLPEPPEGQNEPSSTILALRWPINMMNSTASQFVHHLQVKIQFEPENAPNTIKAISFKENQE